MIRLFWFGCIAFCLLLGACEQERPPCLQPRTVSLIAGCYQNADTGLTSRDTLLPNLNAAGLFADSLKLWILGSKNVRQFPLTLSPLADSCQWVIQPDSAATPLDTLTFMYNRRLQFISNACGYTYFYTLNQVRFTRYNIDSVIIRNPTVNSDANIQHIRIYF